MKVVNMVAVTELDQPLDLVSLASKLPGAEFGPRSPWLKYRIDGKGYVAFYKSGKFLVTGIRSHAALVRRIDEVMTVLRSVGLGVKRKDTLLQNLVCMDEVGLVESLESIQAALPHLDIAYEPEQFPGLMVRGKTATFLLFASGKIVCTGTKDPKIAEQELEWLKAELTAVGALA